ncbi:MAG TPA: hypothetical protein VI076_03355, partial [Actinopolymorphaceae bacterium]
MGGSIGMAAAGGIALPSAVFATSPPSGGGPAGKVEIEDLGPGSIAFPVLGSTAVDDTVYVGSRNLSPTRVAGFHVPTGQVTSTYTLGNGVYVQGMAAHGADVLYAGVSQAQPDVNLYRCDLRTGEVVGVAAIPGQSVATAAVAGDGTVYGSGRPEGTDRGPALFAFDPTSGTLTDLGVPRPDAGQSLAVAVTDTTVYFGCGASSAGGGPAGLFAVDRESGAMTDILPDAMAADREINKIEVFDDLLVIGGAQVGVLDLASGGAWRLAKVGTRQHQFARTGDLLFVASSGGLHQIDLPTWTVTRLGDPAGGLGDYQELAALDGKLVGALSSGHVCTYDLDTGTSDVVELIEAGAPGDAEAGQSVGVLDRKVYVGGNNSVTVHDRDSRTTSKLAVRGEVKDMISVSGTMYMATYSPAAIWEHRPAEGSAPRRLTTLPPRQNRPHVVRWDEHNQLLAVGVRSDAGGGSLCLWNPATEELTAYTDPLGSSQWIWNVAPAHGLIYLAGANSGGHIGHIAAWDPIAGQQVWQMDNPLGDRGGVSSITVVGRRLYGTAIGGPRF